MWVHVKKNVNKRCASERLVRKLSFGTTPIKMAGQVTEVALNSEYLPLGIYEIRLVRLHDAINGNVAPQLDFVSGKDFAQMLFEVGELIENHRMKDELFAEVNKREAELEQMFLTPVDIRKTDISEASEFCVFVFVKDVLIGIPIRSNNFELVPTQSGLDSKDAMDFVNRFLYEKTLTRRQFVYNDECAMQSRQSNPVCVVHFPIIVASTMEDARDYCVEQTNELLLALSLYRDSGGIVFNIVVYSHVLRDSVMFSVSQQYIGNMLTGPLSGESAEVLETYLGGLNCDPINKFLVGLYREARRDRSHDFRYLRVWQILEIMADSCNYNSNSDLLDYEGNVMMDDRSRPRKCKKYVNAVFSLFRDSGIGSTQETWKKVNVWYAFRSAVAHFGSISRFSQLDQPTQQVMNWAQSAYNDISKNGYDQYLNDLTQDTRLLLMKRLVGNL